VNLVDRAKKILLQPKTEWDVISTETVTAADLYRGYIAPLALIGPLAAFIGMSLVGINLPFAGTYRVPVLSGIGTALVSYAFSLAGVYVVAIIVNALAPAFGGQKDQIQALKTAAYASTPGWIAGVLQVLPMLGIVALLASLYGIYLLYLGLPRLMKSTPEKSAGYTTVVVLSVIALSVAVGIATGVGRQAAVGQLGHPGPPQSATPGGPAPVSQLESLSQRLDAANEKMEAAQRSGDTGAQVEAATAMLGAILGGGSAVQPVDPARLKALLPNAVAGLPRTALDAETNGMAGINVAKAEGTYRSGKGETLDLSITDMGGMRGIGLLASWATAEQDRETQDGYEKTGKVDGRPTHEKLDRNGKNGTYGVIVADRFLVEATGRDVDIKDLKQAVNAVGLNNLEALKNEGISK
jgi:hypothetical protein